MIKQDFDKLANAIRKAIVDFGSRRNVELKTTARNKLERAAANVEEIASALQETLDAIPALEDKLQKLWKEEDWTEVMQKQQAREEKMLAEWNEQIAITQGHINNPDLQEHFRNQHQVLLEQAIRERDTMIHMSRSMTRLSTMLSKAKNDTAKFTCVCCMLSAVRLLQEIQSIQWLEQVQLKMVKEQVVSQVEDFKEQAKGSVPKKVETAVITLLSIPSDLMSALVELLEWRRKFDGMNFNTEEDLAAVLAMTDDIEKIASRIRSLNELLVMFLKTDKFWN